MSASSSASSSLLSIFAALVALAFGGLQIWWRHQAEEARRRREREERAVEAKWSALVGRVESLERRAEAGVQADARHDAILAQLTATLAEIREDMREVRAVILRESRR